MATAETTLQPGWTVIAGPGALTLTCEVMQDLGFAEAPGTTTAPALGGRGHDLEFRKTVSMTVTTGQNLWLWAPAAVLLTYTRESAPVA